MNKTPNNPPHKHTFNTGKNFLSRYFLLLYFFPRPHILSQLPITLSWVLFQMYLSCNHVAIQSTILALTGLLRVIAKRWL